MEVALELTADEQRSLDSIFKARQPFPPVYFTDESAAHFRATLEEARKAGTLGIVLKANGLDADPDKWPRAGDYAGNPIPWAVMEAISKAVREFGAKRNLDVRGVSWDKDGDQGRVARGGVNPTARFR